MNRLNHFLWMCRLVSPFSAREQIIADVPRPLSWEMVIAAASAHLIAPFVSPCLEEKQLLDLVPPEARTALEQLYLLNAERNAALTGQIERVSRTLNHAGIEPVWLKGAARLIEGSKWSTMRMMFDLDLWVPDAALEATNNALKADGYRIRTSNDEGGDPHGAALFHDGETARVEVHHHVVPQALARLLPNERLLECARFFDWRGLRVGVPSMGDQILNIASQDLSQMLRGMVGANRPLEFVKLCSEHGVERSVNLIRDAFREAGEAEFAEEYLALASALFGLPGEFTARALVKTFLLRVRNPRLYGLWLAYRDLRLNLEEFPLPAPHVFLEKLMRRTRGALKRRGAW